MLEHQDLSKKELLVLSNGQKARATSNEASIDGSEQDFHSGPGRKEKGRAKVAKAGKKIKKTRESTATSLFGLQGVKGF